MIANGWIKLHRGLNGWGWKKDPNTLALWVHLLLNANPKDDYFMGKIIEKGSLATGLNSLSHETGLSISQIRTSLNKLKSTGEIAIKTGQKFSIISIVKWSEFQLDRTQVDTLHSTPDDTPDDTQIARHIATNKEERNKEERRENIYTPLPPKGEKSDLEKPKRKRSEKKQVEKPECVPQQIWDDFLEIRKTKKAPLTETAWKGIINQSRKAGMPIQSVLEICCQRGWAGFNAEWINQQKPTKGTTNGKRTSHDELREFLDESRNGGFVRDAHLRLR